VLGLGVGTFDEALLVVLIRKKKKSCETASGGYLLHGMDLGVTSLGEIHRLAISDYGEHFKRFSIAPLMVAREIDPSRFPISWVSERESVHMCSGSICAVVRRTRLFHVIKYSTVIRLTALVQGREGSHYCFDESEYRFARPVYPHFLWPHRLWYSYRELLINRIADLVTASSGSGATPRWHRPVGG